MADSKPAPLPVAARLFIGVVSVFGIVVVARSATTLASAAMPLAWVLFALLTIASGMFTLKVPSIETRISISEAFAFASVLLFGPYVGVVTLALDGIRISVRWKMTPGQTVFNFANLALSMWAAGSAFYALSGVPPLYGGPAPSASIVVYLAVMIFTYFAVNTWLTATVVGLARRRSIVSVWKSHYLQLVSSYVAGGSVALLLVLAFREVQFTAIALMLPLLLVCYLTVRTSFGRLEDAKQHVTQLNRLLFSTVETLATAIDAKDEVTHDHVRRVQQGTLALACELGVTDPDLLKGIEAGALLHDTGKIAVPEHILNKPGRLTKAEFEKMKRHAPIGAQILSSIEFPYPVVPIVRHHHENWDGTGYPDGLKGEAIPIGARILSVVDCFDALTSDRPYRRRMTEEQALAIITERRGTMYDPTIVDAFVAAYQRIMPAASSMPHPAAKAIGEARSLDREEPRSEPAPVAHDAGVTDALLAVTSLSRAVEGNARLADVGALLWMIVPQILPCDTFAIFAADDDRDEMVIRYAAGAHAQEIRGISRASGAGIAGWVAANRSAAVNADPVIDLGRSASDPSRPLRSCIAAPLLQGDKVIAVVAVYSGKPTAYADDHVRLLDLLAPRLTSAMGGATAPEFEAAPPQPTLRLVGRTS
ncbi:MAG TPA: HD domain-containing phosphohydrolase [Vicinamibacterales bacterium]